MNKATLIISKQTTTKILMFYLELKLFLYRQY